LNRYIQNLILQGENEHVDFKFEISDAKKIARTFSAFANTKGGKLLVGVKDNGKIAGIRADEEVYMIESAADLFCKPKVVYTLKPWLIDGKTILEVTIAESEVKPHLAPWKDKLWRAFVRVNDQNFLANSVQVEVWKNQRAGKGVLVRYNRLEKELLDYLQNNNEITLSNFCKLCKTKRPIAKKVLVNLVAIGVIEIVHDEQNSKYQLNRNYAFEFKCLIDERK
jgi:predicted HTH transcriptional regulator